MLSNVLKGSMFGADKQNNICVFRASYKLVTTYPICLSCSD